MVVSIGAFAYRSSLSDAFEERINQWQRACQAGRVLSSTKVLCPKCRESYTLVQGAGLTHEVSEDDIDFLTKALSSGHPHHSMYLIVRDLDAYLFQHLCEPLNSSPELAKAGSQIEVPVGL